MKIFKATKNKESTRFDTEGHRHTLERQGTDIQLCTGTSTSHHFNQPRR